ncbi:Tryptophan--tRNA ligase [Candidatus Jidaibacter acanthamoeba]|uniref:Tryptophan--tRNA ligase n=1 Tax=Candidatus Jidaibacter acanthamoebae TaxID=86105 RepID=A0A0C1QGA0_9RICK|nr:tryptophan--tRNA ligase [Candidatus Jidaibacter acanthamoeba]KIE04579.1 Tryptophan--tRNA ligase [Candidatus Jidaibacter acanthamoeba]
MHTSTTKRVFSGLQPTGNLTLGNYLGAIMNWVKMQNEYECIFCLVDQHAITLPHDPKQLRQNLLTNLAAYLACGLDPEKSIIFNQASVSAHAELAWIFSCITPLGWLNRMTQFKEKAGKDRENASLGLYSYPVLMAADILLYHATHIPVGDDQIQHIELARDIAGAFNRRFGSEYFKLPNAITHKIATRIMSLQDGTKKMSKSDPSDWARINLIDDNDIIAKKIKKAKTDAIGEIYYDKENRPEISNLLTIYATLENKSIEEVSAKLSGFNNAKFKDALSELLIEKLSPIRTSINDLVKNEDYLLSVFESGKERANEIASKTINQVKEIVGFIL